MQQKLLHNYTEYRDDLVKNGQPQQLEITAETYEFPIHKGTEEFGDIYSWLFLAEIRNGQRYEAGHQYYPKQLTESELREEVKFMKEDPFRIMYDNFKEGYENGLNKGK